MTTSQASADHGWILRLNYSGRIIDHLGFLMYQSPVAAVAELVANAWDANADNVKMTLPEKLTKAAELKVEDDGNDMSFGECQASFLNVGYARLGTKKIERSKRENRRILGRKGLGQFVGFGIAKLVRIETCDGSLRRVAEHPCHIRQGQRASGQAIWRERPFRAEADRLSQRHAG